MSYFVYILYSTKCDKFYVGYTEHLEKRVYEHNHSKGGIFSRGCAPWILRYKEEYESRVEAMRREKEIKNRKSRKYIELLIGTVG